MINVPYEDMPREIEALLGEIEQLEQENQQLKDNWKELKRWLQEKADNETLISRLYLLGVLNAVEVIEKLDKVME